MSPAVAAVAVALTGVVYALGEHDARPAVEGHLRRHLLRLAVHRRDPHKWFRFGDGGQVTPGWAFAFSIVLLGAPLVAIAAMAACTLFVDVRDRKSITKVVFNAAQITASLAAGAIVLQLLGSSTRRSPMPDRLSYRWGIGIVVSRRTRLHRQRPADLRRPGAALQDQPALDDGSQLLPQHLGRRRTAGALADLRRRDSLQPDDAATARCDRAA